LKNKRLRLFLYPENCTEIAPTFSAVPEKSLFEGGQWFFIPFLRLRAFRQIEIAPILVLTAESRFRP
jgi:hypothetical protein